MNIRTDKSTSGVNSYGRSNIMVEDIASNIRNGKLSNGQRLLSIRDMADKYGVSFGTARSAVDRLVDMGLVKKMHGSGTYVSYLSEPIEKRMKTVYLLLRSKGHIYDHLSADIVSYLTQAGLQAVKVSMNPDDGLDQFETMFNWWRQEPPKAVVTQWLYPGLDSAISGFCSEETRVIATFRPLAGLPEGWSAVMSDWAHATKIAAQHLLSLGHKQIGLVRNNPARFSVDKLVGKRNEYRNQVRAVRDVLRSGGLSGAVVVHNNESIDGGNCDPLAEANMRRMKRWLSRDDRPTALIGHDNRMVAAKRVAEDLGLRVPDDLALVGLGNTPWAEACDLSSVWMHEDIIARRICELINTDDDMFRDSSRHVLVKPELICRSSCGCK